MCRREGQKLFLKGDKCSTPKCPFVTRSYPPGMHGPEGKVRLTGYGIQLREKQKAKRLYGVAERQFRNYFRKAARKKGDTTKELMRLLETRLDNVIFRLGFARSRREARTLLSHRHFLVNGRIINIPSRTVLSGDTVEIKPASRESAFFKDTIAARLSKHQTPSWLSLNPEKWQGKVLSMPEGSELEQGFDPKLIIEYYSR
jgi:small subunit ribosomal protein S4